MTSTAMTPTDYSLAEASAPVGMDAMPSPTSLPPSQDVRAAVVQVSASDTAQKTKSEQPKILHEHGYIPASKSQGVEQTVAVATNDTNQIVTPAFDAVKRHPRAAAAAANAGMAAQVQDEEAPLSVVMAKALTEHKPPPPAAVNTNDTQVVRNQDISATRRPSRAAAAAANAGMARQAKEEQGTLGMLISSALVAPLGDIETKKRTNEAVITPPAKRSRVSTGKNIPQNLLEMESAEHQLPRGKKRRQAPVYEAAPMMEASPIITDLPPLPFTSTSPELGLKGKKAKSKQMTKNNKLSHGVKEIEEDNARHCEFCRKVANICVLMHCHACRRVYHAGCFLHAFKPLVDEKVPILDQMERLQLEAPDRRGNIFRCASCKAAFIDFYESGGYLWDCDCPTCSQPEKAIYYRQRKLVQMMNDMELEKQRKKEKKGQKKSGAASTGGKTPVSTSSRSNSVSRSRRTRGSSATPDNEVTSMRTSRSQGVPTKGQELKKKLKADPASVANESVQESKDGVAAVKNETKVEPMDVDDGGGSQSASGEEAKPEDEKHMKPQQQTSEHLAQGSEPHKITGTLKQETKDAPEVLQQPTSSAQPSSEHTTQKNQEEQKPKIKYEPVGEPEQSELSGDELVSAVRVEREDKCGRWCFPVVCSRTPSLRVSGVMKRGMCKWLLKKVATIQCECCNKMFSYSEFVHHTDSALVKDAKCAEEDPMPFLFVEHRDNTQHTPLDQFQPALRSWVGHQSADNTPTKSRKGRAVTQETLDAVVGPATPEPAETALSRLRELALFKRPKHRSDKTSTAARLTDPATLDFVAQIVCLSPKYVMSMANGSLADRVVRSKTPEPGDSFPRKAGWLAFNRKGALARHITCVCCEKRFDFDAFVGHAGISLSELKKKARQLLYVVEKQDESAVMPYITFSRDLEAAAAGNVLDLYLGGLHPPPPSPRPI